MKKIIQIALSLLLVQMCFAKSSTKDEIFDVLKNQSDDNKISELKINEQENWYVWGRSSNKIKTSTTNGEYQLKYNSTDDFSMTPCDGIKTENKNAYIFYSEVLVTEGSVGTCFVIRNSDDEVINWRSSFKNATANKKWQPCFSIITVDENVSLADKYLSDEIKNRNVTKIQPYFMGDGNTVCKIRNVSFSKYKIKKSENEIVQIENENLKVTFNALGANMKILDKRIGKEYECLENSENTIVISNCTSTENSFTAEAFDSNDLRKIFFTCKLNEDELDCSLSDSFTSSNKYSAVSPCTEDEMTSEYNFPSSIKVSSSEYYVLPIDEGITFYGDDKDMLTGDFANNTGHGICMPFFGATDGSSSWMFVFETPDDAALRLNRNNGMNCSSPVWYSQKGSFGYTRQFKYIFLDKGGYVGIAKRYRKIAEENGNLVTFSMKKEMRGVEGAQRIEKLRGAVNFWTWDSDCAEFCKEVQDAGIERVLWSQRATPEDVDKMNKSENVLTGRYDIYQDVMDPKYFNKVEYISEDWVTDAFPKDIAVDENNNMVQAWPVEVKDRKNKFINCVSLCDVTSPVYARKRIAEDLSTHNYNARFLDTTTASGLRECYSSVHPMTRTQSKLSRIELLGIISKENTLVCGSETGSDYAVPVCDYFEGMMSLGPYRIENAGRNCEKIVNNVPKQVEKFQMGEKYRIPLWELVYHDCVVSMYYWGDYNNKFPSLWNKRDLFNALYATPPMLYTNRNDFKKQKERFVQSYNTSKDITYSTFGVEMMSHEFLTDDREVQKTVFANGVQVIVNFSDKDFNYEGKNISSNSVLQLGIKDFITIK